MRFPPRTCNLAPSCYAAVAKGGLPLVPLLPAMARVAAAERLVQGVAEPEKARRASTHSRRLMLSCWLNPEAAQNKFECEHGTPSTYRTVSYGDGNEPEP